MQENYLLFCITSYGVALDPPSYTIRFLNAILYTSINNNTNANIRMSVCCKDVKDARVEDL